MIPIGGARVVKTCRVCQQQLRCPKSMDQGYQKVEYSATSVTMGIDERCDTGTTSSNKSSDDVETEKSQRCGRVQGRIDHESLDLEGSSAKNKSKCVYG